MLRLVLGLLALTAVVASAGVPLRWARAEGDSADYLLTERMHQQISGPFSSGLEWTREIGISDRILATDDSGAVVRREFQWVRVVVRRDGQDPVVADSREPSPTHSPADNMLVGPFTALAGQSVSFRVDDVGRVSEVEGAPAVLDAMLGPLSQQSLFAGVSAFMTQSDREDRLARQIEQALRIIPGREVEIGEGWDIPIDHATPLGRPIRTALRGDLLSWSGRERAAEIRLRGVLTQGAPDEDDAMQALLPITLTSGTIAGSARFDTGRGRLLRSEYTVETKWVVDAALTEGDAPMQQSIRQTAVMELQEPARP
jgi:hypothetical protein